MHATFTIEPQNGGEACARQTEVLGVHPWAVALATLGWTAVPRVHHSEISRGPALAPTWYIGVRTSGGRRGKVEPSSSASGLIGRLQPGAKHPLEPHHPLLAALTGLENLSELRRWTRQGGPVPSPFPRSPGSPLLVLRSLRDIPPGQTPVPWQQGAEPVVCVASIPLAAALVTAGFVFHPTPQTEDTTGQTGLGFMDNPLRPGLLHQCLVIGQAAVAALMARQDWSRVLSAPLGDPAQHAPGDHPFANALAACLNTKAMALVQQEAAKNPVRILQRRPGSPRRVLVTNSILEGTTPRDEMVKRHLGEHLRAS